MCLCDSNVHNILQNYHTSANLHALFYTHLAIGTVFITLSRIDNKYFNKTSCVWQQMLISWNLIDADVLIALLA